MKISIGMAAALVCIAVLVGVIAALLGAWLARKSGAGIAGCVIRGGSAFAIAVGLVLAIFTFLGLNV
ncbi:hypothetical protein [Streptomyces sp. SAI-144]|uniref:hypothetical protein n=1 Tax=Streptomyces sp. SAI-144 TaxID=2940544 RepID=UPI00247458C2|nr:hypothetical protein [Streptomyces sp. SAI-144]